MNITDLVPFSGYILGSFAFGYAASFLFYIFRRVIWGIT